MSTNTATEEFAQHWASLHFESRQAQWSGSCRTFRQLHGRADRPTIWKVWVEGDRYMTQHGLLDGKLQSTSKLGKAKNKGRSNEVTPEQDALAEARRLCRKKWDFEGYDEFVGDLNIDCRSGTPSVPHLLANLPSSFCLYKPANVLEDCKGLLKKAAAGKTLYTLKRNGLAMWVVIDNNGIVNMYSRRNRISHKNEGARELLDGTMRYEEVIPWATRFPHLIEAVLELDMPHNTMMACELTSMEGDEKKHFAHVCSIEKSLTPVALEKQKKKGWLGLYWWDLPFYNGEDWVSTKTPGERYRTLTGIHQQAGLRSDKVSWIQPIIYRPFDSVDAAVNYAKEHSLEGWVVVDPEGIYGDKGWNLKGKPDRPGKFCAKLKPWYEDDFVVKWDPEKKWGTYGKGRHEKGKKVTLPDKTEVIHGGVGSVGLFQYNTAGELIYICDSSGLKYAHQAGLRKEHFPQVWEIKFTDRSYISQGDDTNALTLPSLVDPRTDKLPAECINDEL